MEVDDNMNEREINVLNWYYAELIDSTKISEQEKEKKKELLRKNYSKNFKLN